MKEDALLKETASVAQAVYEVADEIEAEFGDEKWRTSSKLKNAANNAYFYVAQVVGAGKDQATEFDCVSARKNLLTIKAMYVFASKQKMVTLEPALVVKVDQLVSKIDIELAACKKEHKRRVKEDLKPWLEKYQIWQKISKD